MNIFGAADSGLTFQSHVFIMVQKNNTVKFKDVIDVFEASLNDISDEDVVCVCLIYLLEKGFNGCLHRQMWYPTLMNSIGIVSLIYM